MNAYYEYFLRRGWPLAAVVWLLACFSAGGQNHPVGTTWTNSYEYASGKQEWVYLQTTNGAVQHGLQKEWVASGGSLHLYYTGEYQYGQRWGLTSYYWSNGHLNYTETFAADKLNGLFQNFDYDGNLNREQMYQDDVPNGFYREWYGGQITCLGQYVHGQIDGRWQTWWANPYGPSQDINYQAGVYYGSYKTYYQNGQISVQTSYTSGQLDGDYFSWYENGQPDIVAHYRQNLLNGDYQEGNEQGNPMKKATYADGVELTRSDYTYGTVRSLFSRNYAASEQWDYADQKLVGYQSWYDTGDLCESEKLRQKASDNFLFQMRHGPYTFWNRSKLKIEEGEFINGSLFWLKKWNDAGQLTEDKRMHLTGEVQQWTRMTYYNGIKNQEENLNVDGQWNGLVTYWANDGTLVSRVNYTNGYYDGLAEWFYPSGQPNGSYTYKQGAMNGPCTNFFENGQPRDVTEYRDGKRQGATLVWEFFAGYANYPDLYRFKGQGQYVNDSLQGLYTTYYYSEDPHRVSGTEWCIYEKGVRHGPFGMDSSTSTGENHFRGTYSNDRACGSWSQTGWATDSYSGTHYSINSSGSYDNPCMPLVVPSDPRPPDAHKRITGRVTQLTTGQTLSGATVNGVTTDNSGQYVLEVGDVNSVSLSCSAYNYETRTLTVSLAGLQEKVVNIDLVKVAQTQKPVITSAQSSNGRVFLNGTSCSNNFAVTIQWNGLTPSNVIASVNGYNSIYSVAASQANFPFDMGGAPFIATLNPAGNTLKFTAISQEGISSDPFTLHVAVVPQPGWTQSLAPLTSFKTNDVFTYVSSARWPFQPFKMIVSEESMGSTVWTLWSLFPLIGGREFGIPPTQFFVEGKVNTLGAGSLLAGGYSGFKAADGEIKIKLGGKGKVQFEPGFGMNWKGLDLLMSCEGTIKKPVGPITLCPAFEGVLNLPVVGRPLRWFNDAAVIEGRIYGGFEFTLPVINDKWGLAFNKVNSTFKTGLGLAVVAEIPEVKAEVFGGGEVLTYWQVPADPITQSYMSKLEAKLLGKMTFTVWTYEKSFAIEHLFTYQWATPHLVVSPRISAGSPGFQPVNRGFLQGNKYHLSHTGKGLSPRVSYGLSGNEEAVLEDNVYPNAEPVLAARGDRQAIASVYFNPARDTVQATDIQLLSGSQGVYGAPSIVTNDLQAEFSPSIGFDASNRVVCAWERVRSTNFTSADLADMAPLMEIVYAVFDPTTNQWSTPVALTDNTWLDRKPMLAAAPNGNILLAWISNTNQMLMGDGSSPDVVSYTQWQPDTRSFGPIGTLPYPLVDTMAHALAYDGQQAVLTYVRAQNGLAAGLTNQEVECAIFNGTQWSGPWQISSNHLGNANPQPVCAGISTPRLLWRSGTNLVMQEGWTNGPLTTVRPDSGNAAFLSSQVIAGTNGMMAVVWRAADALGDDLFYCIWDPASRTWSEDLRLTCDASREKNFTGALDGQGTLRLAYLKTDPATSNTSLCSLTHRITRDLAIPANGLSMSPAEPVPGSIVTLQCQVDNVGDLAVSNVTVAFYADSTNNLLGSVTLQPGLIRAGVTGSVATVDWPVPTNVQPFNLIAVVDPANLLGESTRTNNQASLAFLLPDLIPTGLMSELQADGSANLTALLTNAGSWGASNILVHFTTPDRELGIKTLPLLPAGGVAEVGCTIFPGMDFTNGWNSVSVVVDPENTILERDKSNNRYDTTLSLNPDVNGNGLPDWWEDQYLGGADTNWNANTIAPNGLTYQQMYTAGLNPADGNSQFRIEAGSPSSDQGKPLRWDSIANRIYSIYMKKDISDPEPWTRLYRVEGTGGPITYTNYLDYPSLFLRTEVSIP